MHEMGMCEAIVEATVRRAAGRPVSAVRVRVGGHPVDREVVTQGIHLAAMGTVAAGVDVDIVLEPMTARCTRCGHEASGDDPVALIACPACGCLDIEMSGSESVVLESVTFRGRP